MKTINKNTCHYPAGLDNPEKGNSHFTRYSGQARVGQTKKAFTLVELIIVITILAILATIAFVSFKSYFGNARDSVRVSDIKTIHQGLSLYRVKTGELPKPDNGVEIKVGNTLLTYQGETGTGILRQIQINGKAKDPIDGRNYIYSIDKSKTKMQLMGYLETGEDIQYISQNLPNIIKKIYANELNYLNRYVYVYGDTIGILTDDKKVPIQYTQEDTSSGFNILDQESSLITYFGGDVYEGGKSTSSGNILARQLDSGVNGTLPCSSQTYDGYNITQLLHLETKEFTKQINISNGNQIKQLTIECKNGDLDIGKATEIILETNCTTNGYVPYNNECVENKCQNNIPNNATANGLNNDSNKTYHLIPWSHNTSGDCTYVCNLNYTYNAQNKTCDADIRTNQNCGIKPDNSTYNIVSSITQTWNGTTTSWEPTTSSVYNETSSNNECRFKCNPGYTYDIGSNMCLGNSCTTPTTGVHQGITYNLTSTGISHGNIKQIISQNETFGVNPNNGTLSAKFNYSCNAGVLTLTSTENNVGSCSNAGYTFNSNWMSPSCEINTYTVIFRDYDNTTLKTESVNHGQPATAPTNPTRAGHTFTGWNPSSFTNITANTTITAEYGVNGVCGTANGKSRVSAPTTDRCSAGTAGTVTTGASTYTWSCTGLNGGTDATNCSATILKVPNAGTNTLAQTSITWAWTSGGGTATKYEWSPNGTIWTNKSTGLSHQETGLTCNTSYSNRLVRACDDLGTCTTNRTLTTNSTTACAITGVCNNSTRGGCSAGSLSWINSTSSCGTTATWTCTGSNGGSNSSQCSYYNGACAITGVCNNSTRGGCSAGSLSWINSTSSCGTTATWTCTGSNGGSNSSQCSYYNGACAWTCGNSITYGGFTYTTKLGPDGKCWTSTNMKHTPARGNHWCYSNTASNCTSDGRLYTWYAAMGLAEGSTSTTEANDSVCKVLGTGWALPTDSQWSALRYAGATGWTGNKLSGIVSSLPGYRDYGGSFANRGSYGYWWTATRGLSTRSYHRYLDYGNSTVTRYDGNKYHGFSVVCIKN